MRRRMCTSQFDDLPLRVTNLKTPLFHPPCLTVIHPIDTAIITRSKEGTENCKRLKAQRKAHFGFQINHIAC